MILLREFSDYVCLPSVSIRAVLERINRTAHLFQLVVDTDGRLLGTVTDGDIRRAMLTGVGLDAPASVCMKTQPLTGRIGETAKNFEKLGGIGSTRRFLPILDDQSRVAELFIGSKGDLGIATALVMAGGFGKRLGERTKCTPKPLLQVGGRPILDRVISALEDSGVPSITLSVHYLSEQIYDFVSARDNRAHIHFVEETQPLGTAGALGLVKDIERSPVLVVNGDVLTGCDFVALHDFHMRHGLDGTIGVTRYDVDVPYGVIRQDEEGFFAGIEEKPRISNFVAGGVYYLSPAFLALVPLGRPFDMPELLNSGREIGLRIGLFPIHEYWTDVGHPEDLEAADAHHRVDNE
ncbi:sugar phosphate nucleotidyltransferase [Roseobacter sp. HKCCD7870]|uniref:sugar phosphate nucleotidyltransferase n=1 Tax=Roseobacter sp. HKCCD7870 TaxID=3120343 RepID=UPI0030EDE2B9